MKSKPIRSFVAFSALTTQLVSVSAWGAFPTPQAGPEISIDTYAVLDQLSAPKNDEKSCYGEYQDFLSRLRNEHSQRKGFSDYWHEKRHLDFRGYGMRLADGAPYGVVDLSKEKGEYPLALVNASKRFAAAEIEYKNRKKALEAAKVPTDIAMGAFALAGGIGAGQYLFSTSGLGSAILGAPAAAVGSAFVGALFFTPYEQIKAVDQAREQLLAREKEFTQTRLDLIGMIDEDEKATEMRAESLKDRFYEVRDILDGVTLKEWLVVNKLCTQVIEARYSRSPELRQSLADGGDAFATRECVAIMRDFQKGYESGEFCKNEKIYTLNDIRYYLAKKGNARSAMKRNQTVALPASNESRDAKAVQTDAAPATQTATAGRAG